MEPTHTPTVRRGLPLVGSLPEFRRDPIAFCTRLAREQGDLAFFRMGWLRFVQVNRPEWIQQLLTKQAEHLHKSIDFGELRLLLGRGLLTSEDALWKRQRHLIQPAFHRERVHSYATTMLNCANEALARWRPGDEIDLSSELSRLTLEIVGRTLFGAAMARDAQAIGRALQAFMDRFATWLTSPLPLPLAWPLPSNRAVHRAIRTLDEVIMRLVRERRAHPGVRRDDLLGWLLDARDEEGVLDARQLRDELVTLLLAGHETTSLALTWALVMLAQHADAERKLVAELGKVCGGRAVTPGDDAQLQYTSQVVDETLRMRPPVWGTGREALATIHVDGHCIPKGTQILFTQWVTHHDPRYFPEPARFDPDRWSQEQRASIPRFAYFPFGLGPRACVGVHFATLEARLLLAAIVQRFHLELASAQPLGLQPAVTLRPLPGVHMRVHRRTQPGAAHM